jgi:hypothetical protein
MRLVDKQWALRGERMIKASDILCVARSWVGYNEADGSFKEILDVYNSHEPLARGYHIKLTDSWCDAFVSAVAIKAGAVELIGTEVGVEEHVKIFKAKGIWVEDGTVKPKPGWIIVFNWDKDIQPNDDYSDHIGIVERVDGDIITCIEGNKSDSVSRRMIGLGWGYVRGFATPKYEEGEEEDMDFENLTDEQVDALVDRISKRLTSLAPSEYAKEACVEGVKRGLFADGDKDGSVDAPQAFLKRQELAVILKRYGFFINHESA